MRIIGPKELEKINWLKHQFTTHGGNGNLSQLISESKFDDLDLMEIVIECENKFNISIPDRYIDEINRPEDLYKIINKILNENIIHKTKG